MAIPRPHVPHPPLAKLSAALQELGLPPVIRCDPIAPPWVHANYRLQFVPDSGMPPLLLRRRVADPGHDSLAHELAALTALRASSLPVVRSFRILPTESLPWPAALSDLLPGTQGFRIIRSEPDQASAICRAAGEQVARLAQEIRPTWGTAVDGDRFLARHGSWRDEWTDLAWGWWERARLAGTDLGPLGARVWAALEEKLPALDSATHWSLVHGDLHPSNLLFERSDDGSPRLSGIVDWEGALVGDPLLDWALLVELPDATLGHVLQGIGVERVEALLGDADGLDRLEAYRLSRAIRRMAFGALRLFQGDGGVRRSYALEYGRVVCLEALERPLSDKLRAALDQGTSGEVIQKVPAPPVHRVIWQAAEALRYRPALGVHDRALHLAAGLAGVLCDVRHQGLGVELVRRVGPQTHREHSQRIVDREALIAGLVDRAVAHPERPLALALVALFVEALARLGTDASTWPVHDDALRGLAVLVRQLHGREPAPAAGPGKVANSLIELAALEVLADRADTTERRAFAVDSLRMAWEDLTLFGHAPAGSVPFAEVRDHWTEHPDLERPLVIMLLWALERTAGDLPADRDRILGALGLQPPQDQAAAEPATP